MKYRYTKKIIISNFLFWYKFYTQHMLLLCLPNYVNHRWRTSKSSDKFDIINEYVSRRLPPLLVPCLHLMKRSSEEKSPVEKIFTNLKSNACYGQPNSWPDFWNNKTHIITRWLNLKHAGYIHRRACIMSNITSQPRKGHRLHEYI